MVIIADRSFRSKASATQITFFKIVGNNIATKPEFLAFKALGENLLTETEDFEKYYDMVVAKDLRQKAKRDKARGNSIRIALKICDEVNNIANNDPVVYSEAGLDYVEEKNPGRSIGETEILGLSFNMKTRRVYIRVRKADKATSYRIDIKTPEGEELIEFASISLTKGSFPAPTKPGTYRCRVVPRDSKDNLGEPTEWKDLGIS